MTSKHIMRGIQYLFIALASCLWSLVATADELLVAVASNFAAPMAELVARFESQTGHRVEVAYGSSGRLYAQISNGAPFQLFFSADQDKPVRLIEAGLALPESRFTYATGALMLWSADDDLTVADESALMLASVSRIAIANSRVAPYGAAAMEVLQNLSLAASLTSKLVQGENIAQTYQFVDSGNAQLGFVARSQVTRNGNLVKGSGWEIPQQLHAPIRQDAVLLNVARDCDACWQFLEFVQQPAQQRLLTEMGYRTAD